jgi:hypothetical protein
MVPAWRRTDSAAVESWENYHMCTADLFLNDFLFEISDGLMRTPDVLISDNRKFTTFAVGFNW